METVRSLRDRLRDAPPILLDAAVGTELERRGLAGPAPLWSAAALLGDPEAVLQVHRHDVAAGADVLTANTFRVHRRALEKARRREDPRRLTALAVHLAREAAGAGAGGAGGDGHPAFVVGSQAPLEDCYRPDLIPDDEALAREHGERADDLAAAGVDGILVETHNSVRELVAATRAAKATGLPVLVSMVTGGAGHLLSGEDLEEAVRALEPLEPDAIGINCVPTRTLGADLRVLGAAVESAGLAWPLIAYGNVGRPVGDRWEYSDEAPPEEYARSAVDWIGLGARVVGGCCGTGPTHTAALRRRIDADRVRTPAPSSG
jgi:S-methylmethionine-dependent homocysteine/selenocysteine methylase